VSRRASSSRPSASRTALTALVRGRRRRRPHPLLDQPALRREALDARRSLLARALRGPHWRALARVDLAGMRLIRSTAVSDRSTRAIVAFSRTGEHGALWLTIGAAGAVLDGRRRDRWATGIAAVGAAYVANTTIKQVARRPRPQLRDLPPLIPTPTQLSFPSSHAASSFAAASAYSGLLPRTPLYVVAGAMATSRVHLGVHYPSDILVGAALGTVAARAVRAVARTADPVEERWEAHHHRPGQATATDSAAAAAQEGPAR